MKPASRSCQFEMPDGRPCRAGCQRERPFCFAHDPERAADAAEARRLGGLHRRREATLAVVYDVEELRTVEGNQRLLEVAAFDTLALDNSVARNRTLVAVATAGTRLIEAGELAARIAAIEAAIGLGRDARSVNEPEAFPEIEP